MYFTGGVYSSSQYFDLSRSKLVSAIKSWASADRPDKGAPRPSIYKILTNYELAECVFESSSKVVEQELGLKKGADKIKQFYSAHKLRFHSNVLRKV